MVHTHAALFAWTALLVAAERTATNKIVSFEDYVKTFRRAYDPSSSEYGMRRELFDRRAERVNAHNAQRGRLWTAGFNELSDQTDLELMQLLGWRHTKQASGSADNERAAILEEKAVRSGPPAEAVDWTDLAAAKQIVTQGHCGSCWALASAALLQSHYEIHMKGRRTFAAQELVNCVSNPDHCGGQGGCKGATVELAMEYVEKHGLRDVGDMPYRAEDGKCPSADEQRTSLADVKEQSRGGGGALFGFRGWTKLPENKALPLMQALMDGPVGVSVGASTWHDYESGVFDGCDRDVVINHAVLVVGYNGDGEAKWWSVQNSWGPSWGEEGHIRVLRQDTAELEDGYCGVDNDPKLGTACEPYPDSAPVCGMCGILYDSVTPHFAPDGAALISLRGVSRARGLI